jgi:hypothetical protein
MATFATPVPNAIAAARQLVLGVPEYPAYQPRHDSSVTDKLPATASLLMAAIFWPGLHTMYSTQLTGRSVLVAVAVGVPSLTLIRTPTVAERAPGALTLMAYVCGPKAVDVADTPPAVA